MKKLTFLILVLISNLAFADWVPITTHRSSTVVVQAHGGTYSYNEPSTATSKVKIISDQLIVVPSLFRNSLNTVLAQQVASYGASFVGGVVSGLPTVTLEPDAAGRVFFTMSGLSYQATSRYSGHKFGVISYRCINTLTLNNISVTAQYGALDGVMQDDKLGISANPTSKTDCDSNVSWMLPVVAEFLIGLLEDKADRSILSGVKGFIGSVKDALFYGRDSNYLAGINKLIPVSATIPLADGTTFPVGQYVQSNLGYLLANSMVTMKIGRGANPPEIVYGQMQPAGTVFNDTALDLQMATPAGTLSVKITETVIVQWQWQSTCLAEDPTQICHEP